MVLSNSAIIASKPPSVCSDALLSPVAKAPDRKPKRSMCLPMLSKRQPSSRVMRSVCAPVIAAKWALAVAKMRWASKAEKSPRSVCSSQQRENSCSACPIVAHCAGDSRSRTAKAEVLMARRLYPTLDAMAGAPNPAIRERSNTRRAWVAVGTAGSTKPWATVMWLSHCNSGGENWCSPCRHSSVNCARRTVFSARSV